MQDRTSETVNFHSSITDGHSNKEQNSDNQETKNDQEYLSLTNDNECVFIFTHFTSNKTAQGITTLLTDFILGYITFSFVKHDAGPFL